MTTSCRPRLFVYELPSRYRYEGRPEGQDFPPLLLTGAESGSGSSNNNPIPALHDWPVGISLRAADTYVAGGIFFRRSMTSPCRTLDPTQANLFFIPAFTDAFAAGKLCADAVKNASSGESQCSKDRLFERMEASAPGALSARNGSNHLVFTPRHGYNYDLTVSYELKVTDKRLGHAVRFSMEEGGVPFIGRALTKQMFHSTPYASFVHALPSTRWEDLPWRRIPRRDVLVSIAFNAVHNHGPPKPRERINALRSRLLSSCERAADPAICTVLPLSPTKVQVPGYHMRLLHSIAALYWRSTFCLQPTGPLCLLEEAPLPPARSHPMFVWQVTRVHARQSSTRCYSAAFPWSSTAARRCNGRGIGARGCGTRQSLSKRDSFCVRHRCVAMWMWYRTCAIFLRHRSFRCSARSPSTPIASTIARSPTGIGPQAAHQQRCPPHRSRTRTMLLTSHSRVAGVWRRAGHRCSWPLNGRLSGAAWFRGTCARACHCCTVHEL